MNEAPVIDLGDATCKIDGAIVTITPSFGEKLDRTRDLGANFTVNYREKPEWSSVVPDWTGGRGVDYVIEVGRPGTLGQSITAVRLGGHISLIGILTGMGGEVPTAALMAKQARLQGLIVSSRREQQDFGRALDTGAIRPVIDRRFPLEKLDDAFRFEMSGTHFGKIGVAW